MYERVRNLNSVNHDRRDPVWIYTSNTILIDLSFISKRRLVISSEKARETTLSFQWKNDDHNTIGRASDLRSCEAA